MGKLRRASSVLTERGPLALARESGDYLARQARYRLWQHHGSTEVAVGDVRVELRTRDQHECHLVRKLPRLEATMLSAFVEAVREDDVVYDVGSHMGLFACVGAAAAPAGRVVAFEPYPRMRRLLEANVAHNDFDRVRVEPIALADADGTAPFDNPGAAEIAWSGTASIAPTAEDDSIEVETKRGDDLVEAGTLPAPDVVKIDVEGAEPLVIDGLAETLREEVRTVFLELHAATAEGCRRRSVADYDTTPDAVKERLRELGFSLSVLERRGSDTHLQATKR